MKTNIKCWSAVDTPQSYQETVKNRWKATCYSCGRMFMLTLTWRLPLLSIINVHKSQQEANCCCWLSAQTGSYMLYYGIGVHRRVRPAAPSDSTAEASVTLYPFFLLMDTKAVPEASLCECPAKLLLVIKHGGCVWLLLFFGCWEKNKTKSDLDLRWDFFVCMCLWEGGEGDWL